jgi:peroxiredoxin
MAAAMSGVASADDAETALPPKVGQQAPDFALESLSGHSVKLKDLTKQGPVVLVVLRGYPGYQCPLCSRQVGDLLASADAIAKTGARVVLVYPGPGKELKDRAAEFLAERSLPERFSLVVDPDYAFTLAWKLRWDAVRETAYPSTFVIDREGVIRFAQISRTHGGRTPAKTVLEDLGKIK